METKDGQTSTRSYERPRLAVLIAVAATVACSSTSSTGTEGDASTDAATDAATDAPSATDASSASDSSTPPPDSSVTGAGSDASDGTTGACTSPENDAGTCNAVPLAGPGVVSTCSSGEPPQAQGGAITSGVYVLESSTFYGGCPATPEATRTTWSICGSEWALADVQFLVASDLDAGTQPALHANYAVDVGASSVTFTAGCETETATIAGRQYTATSSRLTFVASDSAAPGAVRVSVYVRQ